MELKPTLPPVVGPAPTAMAANSNAEQGSPQLPLPRPQTPTTYYKSPQPRRHYASKITRRRASSTFSLTDLNRRAILDEAIRRGQRSPPPESTSSQPSALEPAYSTPPPHVPDFVEGSSAVPSLSSSAASTPSAAVFGLYPTSEPLPLSSASSISAFVTQAPSLRFESSMEFMMPSQYGSFGNYSTGYQHGYMGDYAGEEKASLAGDSSDQQSTYGGSYAPSPAIVGTSPALSHRGGSAEAESLPETYSYPPSYSYPALSMIPPPPGEYGYAPPQPPHHAQLPGIGSSLGYPPYVGHHSRTSSRGLDELSRPLSGEHETTIYGMAYGGQGAGAYIPTQAGAYLGGGHHQHQHHGSASSLNPIATAAGQDTVRVLDPPKESRCWDHGCNGRVFSTHSNLLRHQREKSGQAAKSTCPRCGAMFTRKTAMNGHMLHDKCKRKSGYGSGSERSGSAGAR